MNNIFELKIKDDGEFQLVNGDLSFIDKIEIHNGACKIYCTFKDFFNMTSPHEMDDADNLVYCDIPALYFKKEDINTALISTIEADGFLPWLTAEDDGVFYNFPLTSHTLAEESKKRLLTWNDERVSGIFTRLLLARGRQIREE